MIVSSITAYSADTDEAEKGLPTLAAETASFCCWSHC